VARLAELAGISPGAESEPTPGEDREEAFLREVAELEERESES
jgi:hypothetical protein